MISGKVIVILLVVVIMSSFFALTTMLYDNAYPENEDIPGENIKPADYPQVEIRDTERRELQSNIVDQKFEIDVFLPRSYAADSSISFPVVYVLDAEYNFGAVSYITRRLIKGEEIPEVIVVGIAYDIDYEDFYLKRGRDMTPTHFAPDEFPLSGGAEKFSRFIRSELIPFINAEYRAIPNDRAVMGHSFGGLFGFYALFKQPDLFNRYVIVSPSLWYDSQVTRGYENEYARSNSNMRAVVYSAVGERETFRMKDQLKKLFDTLKSREYKDLRIVHKIIEDESHRSIPPIAYIKGLRYIFQ